jgi:hypothetical protein
VEYQEDLCSDGVVWEEEAAAWMKKTSPAGDYIEGL